MLASFGTQTLLFGGKSCGKPNNILGLRSNVKYRPDRSCSDFFLVMTDLYDA